MPSFRLSPSTYQRITLVALVALCVIIVSGGAVRLTGSGLGCTDWPTCEDNRIVAPNEFHAWVEFGNRLFTGVVSIAVALAVLGSLVREPRRPDLTRLSWGLVAGVLAQILIGALVVKTELVPAAVSAHFLVSMLLVANALVLHHRAGEEGGSPRTTVTAMVRRLTWAVVLWLGVVLALGTVVTGAGPHSGDPGEVERLGFDIESVTRAHGSAVVILVALVIATLVAGHRTAAPARVRRAGGLLLGVLLGQAAIGYAQYFNGVPALLVAIHLLGATLAWIAALHLLLVEVEHDLTRAAAPAALDTELVPAG
jgi:cytochrome c oxidase assembly protein subunit 15